MYWVDRVSVMVSPALPFSLLFTSSYPNLTSSKDNLTAFLVLPNASYPLQ